MAYAMDSVLDETFGDEVDDDDLLEAESTITKRAKLEIDDRISTLTASILKETWEFSEFRLKQASAIHHLLSGQNALVIFPTGGGKSLVYQVPALAFDKVDASSSGDAPAGGLTLVVSPLIALMKDQVDALRKRGVPAAALDSSQSRESWLETNEAIRNGSLKLLYCAPERLNNEGFIQMITHVKIRLVAIDEAHCISEWGHAFRPDYLKISRFVKEIQAERTLCLTATATERVAADISRAFDIKEDGIFRTPTFRPNLRLLAQSFAKAVEKRAALVDFLRSHSGPSIVYVQTHEDTEDIRVLLQSSGFNVRAYHAGMSAEKRANAQTDFMQSQNIIVVATIAFGMGIDKANIRNVVHYSIPKSVEGYSQEIGRAGRDDLPSACIVYLCHEDIRIMEEWSRADVPSFRSIKGLVGEMMELHKNSQIDEVIERNLNDESRQWDIRRNAVDLLNAQLELRFELLRAITPKYSEYKYLKTANFESKTSDGAELTAILKSVSKMAQKWTKIDVDVAARKGGVERDRVVRTLQQWHDSGAIELSASGVINRFRITSPFPKTQSAKKDIIEKIYDQIKARERSDMARVEQVIALITADECMARKLASHFGDSLPSKYDRKGCANCSFCETGKAVLYRVDKKFSKKPIDEAKVKEILKATRSRDDARYLARVAFGISSPRVTDEKLGKHPAFGILKNCDFEDIVKRFERELEGGVCFFCT